MANIYAHIKPGGIGQGDLVDLLYDVVSSIYGICVKLDADGGVPLTTYTANVYTAIFNGYIEDCHGNAVQNRVAAKDDQFYILRPDAVSDKALIECLYDILDMLETLTEQLDTDTLTDSNYEALCYIAIILYNVENSRGNTLGNNTGYVFNPRGVGNLKELIDLLYMFLDSIETLTEKLDADGTVTDTDYEALYYTATCLTKVENSLGNVLGN